MSSAVESAEQSAYSSALSSSQSSRSPTPLPQVHIQAPNPYRLPRFWRGFVLGGLSTAGAYGLYKLASHFYNKFHRQPSTELVPYTYQQQQPEALPTLIPEPTPYRRRNIKLQHNRHF